MLGIGPLGPLGPLNRERQVPGGVREEASGFEAAADSPTDGWRQECGVMGPAPEAIAAGGQSIAERDALTVLVTVEGLGPATLGRIAARLGGAAATLRVAAGTGGQSAVRDAARDPDRSGGSAHDVELAGRVVRAAADADRILDRVRAAGLSVVTLVDPAYPARLRGIALPPHVLFVRGDAAALDSERAVAVVGTRRPTEGGRRLAAQVGSALARCGAAVVSGLAVGVDGAAHAAVVAEGGITVAVLGGGHEHLYPRAHDRLAQAIVDTGGAVVSEFAPDVPPVAGNFPRRNRVISGMSEATVVIEAAARSGALTTAAWALEQGRGCFLVPGAIDAPMSAGCLAFLRECGGEARIVAGIPQLIEDLGLTTRPAARNHAPGEARAMGRARPAAPAAEAILQSLGEAERRAAEGLVAGLATVDELVAAMDMPVAAVLGAITLLEIRGLVAGAYGRYRPSGALAGAPGRHG